MADDTVDAAVTMLHPFLKPMSHKTKKKYDDNMPYSYLYQTHVDNRVENIRIKNKFLPKQPKYYYEDDDYALPSIHVVKNNALGRTSKLKMMEYIEYELRQTGNEPILMALVDDNPRWSCELIGNTSELKSTGQFGMGVFEGKQQAYYKFFDAQPLGAEHIVQASCQLMRKQITERIWQEIEETIRYIVGALALTQISAPSHPYKIIP